MKKIDKLGWFAATALVLSLITTAVMAGEMTKYDSDDAVGVNSEVLFPAHDTPNRIIGLLAKTGFATGRIDIYARANVTNNPQAVTNATLAVGATNVGVSATSAFSAGDWVVYQWADGVTSNTQVRNLSAGTYVELSNGLYRAGAAGDKLYKLSKQGSIYTANTALNLAGDALFVTPSDSPLWLQYVATNANYITVTVNW